MLSESEIASQAFQEGIMAAHSGVTPVCPYNNMYESRNYRLWYSALTQERRRINATTSK